MFQFKQNAGWLIALFLIGFIIYSFNLNNELFWDDDDWIINNPNVHFLSGENIKSIFTTDILHGFGLNSNYYRPLLLLSFAFNWAIGGSNPFGYHLISNLFHITNALLVFSILYLVFRKQRPAFLATLIWLVHPVNVEAVAYISGRGDPMSVFFILLGLLFFIKSQYSVIHNSRFIILSILAMILAILSRETAVLFPALVMVLYVSFISKHRFWWAFRAAFMKTIPFWVVSVIYFIMRLTVLNFQNTLNFYSQANIYTEHLSYRLYTFGHAIVEYFKLIFVPLGLHMERELPVNTSLFQWPVWLGFAIVLSIMYLVVRSYQTKKIWFFGFAWFFIALSPVSGIIPINALIYEHWLYLPLIGLAALVGFYLDKIFLILKTRKLNTLYLIFTTFLVFYVSFLGIQTIKRNIAWGNKITFYEDILKYNPNTVRILNNLGNAYAAEGDLLKAAEMYEGAIQLPDGQEFAQPYYNLANSYRDQNRPEEAANMYKKAIEVDPNFPFAYKNLAVLYVRYGFFAQAIEVLKELKIIMPDDPLVDEAIRRLEADINASRK